MYNSSKIAAVIVAGGSSQRMGFDKLYYKIDGKEVLWHSVKAFCDNSMIDNIVVAAQSGSVARAEKILKNFNKPVKIVEGGNTRNESVQKGVAAAGNADYIAIHDAARPYVSQKIITDTVLLAVKTGAAAPAVQVKDTIKQINEDGTVNGTPCRDFLRAVQTPQVFYRKSYLEAVKAQNGSAVTDDCMIMENAGFTVSLSQGDYKNIKITTREDLPVDKGTNAFRIGHGYDVHRLVPGRKLILGGTQIPHETGLLGHSDADVLLHSVSDALLGAAALGDIGRHFPDSDEKYKNADSLKLLRRVNEILNENGWRVVNVDATVLCQRPKLAPYIDDMRRNIAAALCTEKENISVKATTEEGLGFTGEEKGIAAHAVAMIEKQ